MNEFWDKGYETAHLLNILVHVAFGTLGIVLGTLQLLRQKGDGPHRMVGRAFVLCGAVVSSTALIGTLTFNRDPFLMTLTVAATYNWVAGWRALKIRETGPQFFDNAFAVAAALYCLGFTLYAQFLAAPDWSSITVYSTIGFLLALTFYDLARNFGGRAWVRRTWIGEHIYKIIGALSAMTSAAVGNLFLTLGAWGQVGPSFAFLLVTVVFMIRYRRAPA